MAQSYQNVNNDLNKMVPFLLERKYCYYEPNSRNNMNMSRYNFNTAQKPLIAKYYNNNTYPIDIHSPAQFIVTLYKINAFEKYKDLAESVMNWTIKNMRDNKGYFYYQIKKRFSSKIPYMRWAQSWMFYSMTFYLMEGKNEL